jgi:alpha-1,4-digalacturonate transport system substrate-binding protein
MRKTMSLLLVLMLILSAVPVLGQDDDVVTLRMTYYRDGNEDVVMEDLLERFHAENPDIRVELDVVDYRTGILESLPLQLEAGTGPDMARVTNLGGLAEYYLDMTPYLEDTAYWEENFGPFLAWLRPAGDEDGIYGFQTQLTVTGPYINRTLFEQAGVPIPSDESDSVTWAEWAEATSQVADELGLEFPMAMDRSGHRFAGPAISMGAQYFDEEGNPVLTDEGFVETANMLVDWHDEGVMLPDVWAGGSGGYASGLEFFVNGQIVMLMSGSWQINNMTTQVGDLFDWQVVPNPCGPGGCTGMPGGAAVVALAQTEHPEEVTRVMEFLAQTENIREFSERTLFIPAHAGVAETGVEFDTESDQAREALNTFVGQVATLEPTAFDLQAYPNNFVIFNATVDRLTQAITGELTVDEAVARIQSDVDEALAEE